MFTHTQMLDSKLTHVLGALRMSLSQYDGDPLY